MDDAHALGLWETKTEGWNVVIGTLSKSLGSQGGFAASSGEVIDLLINKARPFIFTTGLSPLSVAAAQAALSLIQEDSKGSERVKEISLRLRNGLKDLKFNTLGSESQIVPILLGEADRALACAEHLLQAGIFAPAIRPPDGSCWPMPHPFFCDG